MLKIYTKSMDTLFEYEKRYANELKENKIGILREIKVSKKELDDIAKHISALYRYDKKALQYSFPITVSLFLVWCTVYEYKDGSMWSNIFEKLEIKSSVNYANHMEFFGDIFLNVLNENGLMQVKEGEGKKYLSPILMHGYISNHYAYDLFDYLNKVYSIILEEDTSEQAIDSVWNDIFSEDIEFRNIKREINLLKYKREEILEEIKYYNEIDDEIKNINFNDVEELELEVYDLEKLDESNRKKIENINKKIYTNASINEQIIDLDSLFSKLCTKLSSVADNESLEEINNLIDEVRDIIQNKNNLLGIKKEQLIKENRGLNNKLAIKRETLVLIKTKITALGQGVLDDGWDEIKRYSKLKEELEIVELQIKRKQKYEDVVRFEKNSTIKQILTASLYNLKISYPEYFKDFMTGTIQMMGSYFSGEEVDDTHPLYEIFMEWLHRGPKKIIPTEVSFLNPDKEENYNTGKRLMLQTMKKPYIQLDTDNLFLNIVVPEQIFTFKQNIDSKPYYIFINEEGEKFDIDVDYVYQNQNLYIKGTEILLESISYEYLLFQWYNLRETHDVSLDEIMIFDESGTLLNKDKVKNGYYYIVCEKSWFINNAIIVGEYELLLDNYKIFEVYLSETKITLYNEDKNKAHDIIATNYQMFKLDNYKPIEGIYSDNLPVVTGIMPELLVNHIEIDPNLINFKISINDNLIYNRELKHSIEEYQTDEDENITRINIYKLLKLKSTAYKIKILLVHTNGEQILEEEFYFLPKTQFKYINEGLSIKIGRGMKLSSANCKQKGMKYLIPLKDKEGETFSIYYDRHGWVKLWAEVPILNIKIFEKDGKEYPKKSILYGNKRENLKNLFIQWETNSKRIESILVFDNHNHFETRVYMKDCKARTSIEPYFDIFNGKDTGQLYYRAEGKNILIEEGLILELYDKWEVSNIRVYQKEEVDEYILGIDYDENFVFEEPKYLEVLNDGRTIIKKIIKDQIYIYIKKKDLISNKIKINILYDEEYEDVFGMKKKTIVAGTTDIKLKSRINEIDKILNNGILVTGFKYDGEIHAIKNPLDLAMVKKTNSKNFIGEEMYMSNILSNGVSQNVYFYIDTEKKVLPFLIDKDNDGAQYDPKDGRVFWEICKDKDVMAPLENIAYVIKEER